MMWKMSYCDVIVKATFPILIRDTDKSDLESSLSVITTGSSNQSSSWCISHCRLLLLVSVGVARLWKSPHSHHFAIVSVTPMNTPCYIVWIVPVSHKLSEAWGCTFPYNCWQDEYTNSLFSMAEMWFFTYVVKYRYYYNTKLLFF